MTEFDGAVAIVTGGASGLGAATAALLAERGARVAVLDRDTAGVPSELFSVVCDVTDAAGVEAAVAAVADHFGAIDIVINNAGIGAAGDIAANSDDEWHRVLDVNVVGIARVTRAALPHLRRSSRAAVVNTCSIAGIAGLPNRALYSASKGAVAALTLAMAADHVREGIRVNAVTPGTADTPWVGAAAGCRRRPRRGGCGAARPPADGATRHRRGGRERHRVPRLAERVVDHRHAARRRRRHARAARLTELSRERSSLSSLVLRQHRRRPARIAPELRGPGDRRRPVAIAHGIQHGVEARPVVPVDRQLGRHAVGAPEL